MPSTTPHLRVLIERRTLLKGGLALLASRFVGHASGAEPSPPRLGFKPIAASTEDAVRVPEGYTARVLTRWGDPVGHASGQPAFKTDAANSAAEQAVQFGMHHDGMAFFPLPRGGDESAHGLLVTNHEYIDRGLLHPPRPEFAFTAEQVQKEVNAHGVSICEVTRGASGWEVKRPSTYARRITGDTRMRIAGPARGHALMRTALNEAGDVAWGTLSNCANGRTPWGTYLTCEENWNFYFTLDGTPTAHQRLYGLGRPSEYAWSKATPSNPLFERFDLGRHPNEANRFGWVVEIDPYDPAGEPVKRTALGRFKHENAAVVVAPDGRVVVYMGDDESDQYVYKFVSSGRFDPRKPETGRDILDEGVLYAARFDADGRGTWLPLTPEQPAIRAAGLTDLGAVMVNARAAADAVGATRMDRPEWFTVHPETGEVYGTLTNNASRTQPNAANPRTSNVHGHVLRWREKDPTSDAFEWDVFVLAGDPTSTAENLRGDIRGDLFSAPDGLSFDARGVLWIQTDMSSTRMWHPKLAADREGFRAFGNNQMLAVVPSEGVVRRFLTGPVGAEITGFTMTPDGRTLFVNVQHPGEPLSPAVSSDPADPARWSQWPDGGRPRSATLVITRDDGGIIGA